MKTFVVTTKIEIEADNQNQAEDLVLGLDITDSAGDSIPCFVEIEEVEELNG